MTIKNCRPNFSSPRSLIGARRAFPRDANRDQNPPTRSLANFRPRIRPANLPARSPAQRTRSNNASQSLLAAHERPARDRTQPPGSSSGFRVQPRVGATLPPVPELFLTSSTSSQPFVPCHRVRRHRLQISRESYQGRLRYLYLRLGEVAD